MNTENDHEVMMDSEIYSNARYGIQSESERNFWSLYFIFVLLSTLIGDTLILYASFHKIALKINPIIVAVMQHIAVSDLSHTFLCSAPKMISLQANNWILKSAFCGLRSYLSVVVYATGMFLVALLTSLKFLLLKHPARLAGWTVFKTHLICSFIWFFNLVPGIILLAVSDIKKITVYFDYRIYACTYDLKVVDKSLNIPDNLCVSLVTALSLLIIVGATVPTVIYLIKASKTSRRVRGRIPWQGAITVVMTATFFCVANVPHLVSLMMTDKETSLSSISFYRISYFLLSINTICNFYIYTLTIRSFRVFLSSKFRSVATKLVYYRNQRGRLSKEGKNEEEQKILRLT